MAATDTEGDSAAPGARERILEASYDLFSRQGVQAVGIDAIITRSGVARQTLYRHFDSKQDLVLAFLERREKLWTKGWLQAEVQRRASDPRERLLAIFDVFGEWFQLDDYEGCSFINVILEMPDRADPIHRAGTAYLAGIRNFLEGLASTARPISWARTAAARSPSAAAMIEPFMRMCHLRANASASAMPAARASPSRKLRMPAR